MADEAFDCRGTVYTLESEEEERLLKLKWHIHLGE